MSINGKVEVKQISFCSQCHSDVYKCFNCYEYFKANDFVSCGDDGNHICEQCYADYGPTAINPEPEVKGL